MRIEVIPGAAYLVKGWVSPVLFEPLLEEVNPFLKCQLTWSKGWPSRATQDHKMARFGDPEVTYSYKGKKKPIHPWTATTQHVRELIQRDLLWNPNCLAVNTYGPGGDLHPHRDSEFIPELGERPVIVSVSFGSARTFILYPLDSKGKRSKEGIATLLEAGDLFVMHGDCDEKYHHAIKPESVEGLRLSLTYRKHHGTETS